MANDSANGKSSNSMWGGRFNAGPASIMREINASIGFDRRFFAEDIAGSKAHSDMLAAKGILTTEDRDAIHRGLDQVQAEIEAGKMTWDPALEDIHMHVESRLKEIIGDAAGRLHTARSRNDQVATDFRLWIRNTIDALDDMLADLQKALVTRAEEHAETVMPGFTHLQTAQPVTFGHHLMAYYEMIRRDRGRLKDSRARLNECPLGSAALAGTPYPIDREMTARALGFAGPTRNSLDAVSDRDFALEYLSALSISAIHLSRLSEEIIVWMSAPFRFVSLSDAFTTGSSIMPQKRNPDAAELVRAKVGRVHGALTSLTIMLKGLPLAYSKDMQEDKEPVFEATDAYQLSVAAITGMILDLKANATHMRAQAGQGYSTATDLADWLVRSLNMPFREAHHVTGSLVAKAEAKACDLADLTLDEMRDVHPGITEAVFGVLTVEQSVAARTSFGGTAPAGVRARIQDAKKELGL